MIKIKEEYLAIFVTAFAITFIIGMAITIIDKKKEITKLETVIEQKNEDIKDLYVLGDIQAYTALDSGTGCSYFMLKALSTIEPDDGNIFFVHLQDSFDYCESLINKAEGFYIKNTPPNEYIEYNNKMKELSGILTDWTDKEANEMFEDKDDMLGFADSLFNTADNTSKDNGIDKRANKIFE